MTSLLDRFAAKVTITQPTACWQWTGAIQTRGYGSFCVDGHSHLAHRWAYAQLCEPIPAGMVINHLCGNKSCVNPAHMEVTTVGGNNVHALAAGLSAPSPLSRDNAAKIVCRNGHGYTADNTYVNPQGHRACRECKRESDRRRAARQATA